MKHINDKTFNDSLPVYIMPLMRENTKWEK